MNEDTGDTGASLDALDQLRAQMRSHRLLSHDEHLALISRAQDGDPEALDAMVAHNLRLVFFTAKRYIGHGVPFLDLVQEGCIGLVKAVERYDLDSGHQFSTYATWWVFQALTRTLANQGRSIRVPVYIHTAMSAARRTHAHDDEARGKALRELVGDWHIVSLDEPVDPNDPNGPTIGDYVPDEEAPELDPDRVCRAQAVEQLLDRACLTAHERLVITLRYGLDGQGERTLIETGRRMGCSRERARQIQAHALTKLRLIATHSADRDALLALVA